MKIETISVYFYIAWH